MDPTNSMDLRIQTILDSRDLAMAANYMRANGIHFYSVSDLVRKCIHMFAYQYIKEGNPPITSRQDAKDALGEYAQRGRGYDKERSFNRPLYSQLNSSPRHNVDDVTFKQAVDKFLLEHPEFTRGEAENTIKRLTRGV